MTDRHGPSTGRIVVGVTGSIACYKAAYLVSRLVQRGQAVVVIMTHSACRLVTPHTFRALTNRPVITDLFEESADAPMGHLSATDDADLLVVAPATANFIGKFAAGIGDDALTTAILACSSPILVAPAMNPAMWANPIVQQNVKRLKGLGCHFIGPQEGRLAEGGVGFGRMTEPEDILVRIEQLRASGRAAPD